MGNLEIYCPLCNRLFHSEAEMLEHYDKESDIQRPAVKHTVDLKDKPLIGIEAMYLGGHSAYTMQTIGLLYIFPEPHNKVVFESDRFALEIPIDNIRGTKVATEKELSALRIFLVGLIAFGWKQEKKMYLISFEDELGETQSTVFEHTPRFVQFASLLYNLRLENNRKKKT